MIEYLYLIAPLTFLVLALTPKRTAKICTIFLNTNHCPTFVLSLNKKPMIYYQISCANLASQLIELTLSVDIEDKSPVEIQLPAWRAGRYQLANYAQNIRNFHAVDQKKNTLFFEKTSKDRWIIYPQNPGKIQIHYQYWAGKMDAGSAWVDDQQVYINLVNCCFEIIGRGHEAIQITLDLPEYDKRMSTLILHDSNSWKAENFQMLADSTILAAKSLARLDYRAAATDFNLWINGEVHFDKNLLLDSFKAFTEKVIADFGEFPELEYHFIFQLLPYPHYHGVEHRRGTVITFGPAESLQDPEVMEELLSISCHELYHAWNVCRIRPKELLPYDFSKESYTNTGLVLEGITTYMGDLYLLKSGAYDLSTYLRHLEKIIARESATFGWKNYTILESSLDLWLDGYVPGIPDRKVNIYTRGALLALCIDIRLLKSGSSLASVMKKMWEQFGKPMFGYTLQDFEKIVYGEFSDQDEITRFFSDFVYGYRDLFPTLRDTFAEIGLQLEATCGEDWLLHESGIRTTAEGVILQLHPESKASFVLMRNDQITSWPLPKPSHGDLFEINIERGGRSLTLSFQLENGNFFPTYRLFEAEKNDLRIKWSD
jgi:predicted metalloprotease with PDZ domain